jgi:osmotically-inducible protein OsmY
VTEMEAAGAVSDGDLTDLVRSLLEGACLPLGPGCVNVACGHVTLEGSVDTWSQRDGVERSVRSLPDLRGLTNRLRVKQERLALDCERAIYEARACPL